MCCIIVQQAVNMHPSRFCPWFRSKISKIIPSFVTSVFGGCASFVSMTVLPTFGRRPTLPTSYLSKICATSGPEFANSRLASAKPRTTKLSRTSPGAKPAFPISVCHSRTPILELHWIFVTYNIAVSHTTCYGKTPAFTCFYLILPWPRRIVRHMHFLTTTGGVLGNPMFS